MAEKNRAARQNTPNTLLFQFRKLQIVVTSLLPLGQGRKSGNLVNGPWRILQNTYISRQWLQLERLTCQVWSCLSGIEPPFTPETFKFAIRVLFCTQWSKDTKRSHLRGITLQFSEIWVHQWQRLSTSSWLKEVFMSKWRTMRSRSISSKVSWFHNSLDLNGDVISSWLNCINTRFLNQRNS